MRNECSGAGVGATAAGWRCGGSWQNQTGGPALTLTSRLLSAQRGQRHKNCPLFSRLSHLHAGLQSVTARPEEQTTAGTVVHFIARKCHCTLQQRSCTHERKINCIWRWTNVQICFKSNHTLLLRWEKKRDFLVVGIVISRGWCVLLVKKSLLNNRQYQR